MVQQKQTKKTFSHLTWKNIFDSKEVSEGKREEFKESFNAKTRNKLNIYQR